MTRRYRSVFATSDHAPITALDQLRKHRYDAKLGLFLGRTCVGSGELFSEGHDVRTEATEIKHEHRGKGHGIELYQRLVRTARRLGARRIYSSWHLNKLSRRMWKEKLPRLFDVQVSRRNRRCRRCGCRSAQERYFIALRDNPSRRKA